MCHVVRHAATCVYSAIDRFHSHAIKIGILLDINKEGTSPSFGSVRFPKPEIFSKCFTEIYRAKYGLSKGLINVGAASKTVI